VKFSFEHGGETFEFECFDSYASRWICNESLQGRSYPGFDFVTDVNLVMDVGAYVGDSSLYFSLQYPDAQIFAFEPATEPYRLLEKNTRSRSNVHCYNYGLSSSDSNQRLYKGVVDPAASSVRKRRESSEQGERVRLKSVQTWLEEHDVHAVDVLKIDTEGCEVPILRGMREFLPSVKIAYLEFHSEDDRKEIDRLLGDTHDLVVGKMVHHLGTVTYAAKDALPPEQDDGHHFSGPDQEAPGGRGRRAL
jgi:FkbM family methyltransferase